MSRPRDPAASRFVSYLRVSTDRQGRSGLGLEAQREAVARYLAGPAGGAGIRLGAEYVEIESGKRSDRPQLAAALALCRATGAVLVVAKLDSLARDVDFLRRCFADVGDAGIQFCDLPDPPPGAAGVGGGENPRIDGAESIPDTQGRRKVCRFMHPPPTSVTDSGWQVDPCKCWPSATAFGGLRH